VADSLSIQENFEGVFLEKVSGERGLQRLIINEKKGSTYVDHQGKAI